MATNPIIAGFAGLTRFSGRDRPGRFWPYAGVVFVIVFMAMGLAMSLAASPMFAAMPEFAEANQKAVTVETAPGYYWVQVDGSHPDTPMPDMGLIAPLMGSVVVLAIGLLAAAVCRRLHDTGRAGWWGLLPVPFLLIALMIFPSLVNDVVAGVDVDMALFMLLFLNNVAYMAMLITLVVLLVRPSKPDANRYGPRPAQGSERSE